MKRKKTSQEDIAYSVAILKNISSFAGSKSFIDDIRNGLKHDRISSAVAHSDTPRLFEWILTILSLQGVSDAAAFGYIKRFGTVKWRDVHRGLGKKALCPLLRDYWSFTGCAYKKEALTCSHQHLLTRCPLPQHALRNGRLNQTAYSLYFFLRDIAKNDLTGWIRKQLDHKIHGGDATARLIKPLSGIFGASNKVVGLVVSELLLGAGRYRYWKKAGAEIIVIDSLTHNFLHRTGISKRMSAEHSYGPQCYGPGGCATTIANLAKLIDAKQYNTNYPSYFPRFIQRAIWSYCASDEFNICNGNRINDLRRCNNDSCRLFVICDRIRLK